MSQMWADCEIRNYNINKSQMKSYPVNSLLLELFLESIVMLSKHPVFKGCPKDCLQWRFYRTGSWQPGFMSILGISNFVGQVTFLGSSITSFNLKLLTNVSDSQVEDLGIC